MCGIRLKEGAVTKAAVIMTTKHLLSELLMSSACVSKIFTLERVRFSSFLKLTPKAFIIAALKIWNFMSIWPAGDDNMYKLLHTSCAAGGS